MRNRTFGWAAVAAIGALLTGWARSETAPAAPDSATHRAAQEQAVAAFQPGLEPRAIEILETASAHLAASTSMTFTAVVSYEGPSLLGPPLIYSTKSQVTLRRPNKLKVITLGDGPPSEFYYDGKIMMAFAPKENLVAIADAPPTVDEALAAAYEGASIYFFSPLSSSPTPTRTWPAILRPRSILGNHRLWAARRRTWWRSPQRMFLLRFGSEPKTSCHVVYMPFV